MTVELRTDDSRAELRQTVQAVAVRPPGVAEVSYVASVDIPSPGWWRLAVSAQTGATRLAGAVSVPGPGAGQHRPAGSQGARRAYPDARLVDRWPAVPFVHLEPYAYDVITDTAVIRGSLSSPTMVPAADAWGVASAPWGAGSMPWVFVVDGSGTVRAKYQGVVGSDDVDVISSMIAAGG